MRDLNRNRRLIRSLRSGLGAALALTLLVPLAVSAQDLDDPGGGDLDDVVFAVDEARGKARVALIKKLCAMKDPRVAEGLIQVLANPQPTDSADIKDLAFKALYRLNSKAIVPELKKMIGSDQEGRVIYAIRLLGRALGPAAFDLVSPFLKSQGETLRAAIRAMGETRDPRAAAMLHVTLKGLGRKSDDAVFVRMSLIRLGDKTQLKPLIVSYQGIIDEAFRLKTAWHFVDNPLLIKRMKKRVAFLWTVEAELRAYFDDLSEEMIPPFIEAAEETDANSAKQIVLDMVTRTVDRKRAPHFAGMLDSRYVAFRLAIAEEYLRLKDPALRKKVVASVRKHLSAKAWQDRRCAVSSTWLLPESDRLATLRKAASDPVVWVRAEAVRELGRWRTPEALALIKQVRGSTDHDELQYICRCALAGLEEDLHGVR